MLETLRGRGNGAESTDKGGLEVAETNIEEVIEQGVKEVESVEQGTTQEKGHKEIGSTVMGRCRLPTTAQTDDCMAAQSNIEKVGTHDSFSRMASTSSPSTSDDITDEEEGEEEGGVPITDNFRPVKKGGGGPGYDSYEFLYRSPN